MEMISTTIYSIPLKNVKVNIRKKNILKLLAAGFLDEKPVIGERVILPKYVLILKFSYHFNFIYFDSKYMSGANLGKIRFNVSEQADIID